MKKLTMFLFVMFFILSTFSCGGENPVVKEGASSPKETPAETPNFRTSANDIGKVVLIGNFDSFNGMSTTNGITELTPAGTLNLDFRPSAGTGPNGPIFALYIDPTSGEMLLGGQFDHYNGVAVGHIVKLDRDGEVETSFNGNGSGFNGDVKAIAVDSNGYIMVGGSFTQYDGVNVDSLARLYPDGTHSGIYLSIPCISGDSICGSGFNGTINSIVIQPDDKILVGGGFTNIGGGSPGYKYLIRFNSDLTIDTYFDTTAGTGLNLNAPVNSIALRGDGTGSILIGGDFTSCTMGQCTLATYTVIPVAVVVSAAVGLTGLDYNYNDPNGTGYTIEDSYGHQFILIDSYTFTSAGSQTLNFRAKNLGPLNVLQNTVTIPVTTVNEVIAVSNADTISVGTYDTCADPCMHLAKISASGVLDTNFKTALGAGANGRIDTIAVQHAESSGDDKILIGGVFTEVNNNNVNYIARLDSDGYLDTSFNSSGTGFDGAVTSIDIQNDNKKVVVSGLFTTVNGTDQSGIVRLTADGDVDETFSVGTGLSGVQYYNRAVVINADPDILEAPVFSPTPTDQFVLAITSPSMPTEGTYISGTNVTITSSYKVYYTTDGNVPNLSSAQYDPNNGITLTKTVVITARAYDPTTTSWSNSSIATYIVVDIFIAGEQTSYNNNNSNGLTKLLVDGKMDTSYNNGGSGATGAGYYSLGWVYSMVFQSDGKAIISGYFNSYNGTSQVGIVRLNTDGSVDTTFTANVSGPSSGQYAGYSLVYTMALQSDGKVIIGGEFDTVNGVARSRIARLNPDGSLDPTFDPGFGFDAFVQAVAVQPNDGKVLVGGIFTHFNGSTSAYQHQGLVRLNNDGSLDTTFSSDIGFSPVPSWNLIYPISIQPDGKILVGGIFSSYKYNGSTTSLSNIVRLKADGSVDTSFSASANGFVGSIVQLSSGNILLAGDFTTYNSATHNRIVRVDSYGAVDTSFTGATSSGYGADDKIWSMTVQPDGNILVAGAFHHYDGVSRNYIARVCGVTSTPNCTGGPGFLDASFDPGTGTTGATINGKTYGAVNMVAISPVWATNLFIGGTFTKYHDSGTARANVAKVITTGYDPAKVATADSSFTTLLGGPNGTVSTIANRERGNYVGIPNIVVGGSFTTYNNNNSVGIAGVTASGATDTLFSAYANVAGILASATQSDGKIIVGGSFSSINGTTRGKIARLNTDGSVDTTFNSATGFSGGTGTVYAVAVEDDGSIIAGGDFTAYNGTPCTRIAKINSDGTVNGTFCGSASTSGTVYAIAVEPLTGKVIIGGNFTTVNSGTRGYIAKLATNGTLDSSFTGAGASGIVYALACDGYLTSSYLLYVGGNFTTYNGNAHKRVARVFPDGTDDTSFVSGGSTSGANGVVKAIAVQRMYDDAGVTSSRVYIGGGFTTYGSTGALGIARLCSATGSRFCSGGPGSRDTIFDTTYGVNTGVGNGTVSSINSTVKRTWY